jgi:uncharacterized protein
MRVFFPVIFSMVLIAILSTVEILLLRSLHRDWWQHRWVRRASWAVPSLGFLFLALWALGIAIGQTLVGAIGATGTSIVFVVGAALMLSLPLSGVTHAIAGWMHRRRSRVRKVPLTELPVEASRRRLLTTAAAAFPVAALSAGGTGLLNGLDDVRVHTVPLSFPGLPADLKGLRIAHISDVHVGLALGLDDLERMAERTAQAKPDLVLITGDFADDTDAYPDALKLAAAIAPRLGVYASIGNHEYFRGINEIFRAYERGPVPLLLDSGAAVSVGNSTIWLAGADDPRSLSRMKPDFFPRTLERSLRDAPSDAFVISLSHRPESFPEAARLGVPLTLAGHTHGGQIGFAGRSVVEYLVPSKYMWGHYRLNGSQLYVSAGAGHWFPFRLGVPAEIPIYTLT